VILSHLALSDVILDGRGSSVSGLDGRGSSVSGTYLQCSRSLRLALLMAQVSLLSCLDSLDRSTGGQQHSGFLVVVVVIVVVVGFSVVHYQHAGTVGGASGHMIEFSQQVACTALSGESKPGYASMEYCRYE